MNTQSKKKSNMKKLLKTILVVGLLLFVLIILPFQIPWNSSTDSFIAKKLGIKEADAPRTPSGLIDITSLTDDALFKGVTSENNIVVDYVQVFGIEKMPAELHNRFLQRLQLSDAEGSTPWVTWQEQNGSLATSETDYEMALARPWLASENKAALDWITANKNSLDQFVTASKKTRYYHPLVSGDDGDALGCLLPYAQEAREAAIGLSVRALNHLANDGVDAALVDLAATRRLGFLMQQSSTLVEQLVGMAMMGIAANAEAQVLAGGKLNEQQCADYRQVIGQTRGWASLAGTMVKGERSFQLDVVQRFENQGNYMETIGLEGGFSNLSLVNGLRRVTDWEQAAVVVDQFMTRVVEITEVPNDADRLRQLANLENEMQAMQVQSESVGGKLKLFLGAGARGQLAGEGCILMLAPAMKHVEQAAVRTRQLSDFSDLAFALEQYRIKNKSFPTDLSLLSPNLLKTIPIDRFNGKPIRYELMTDRTGYRLTSVYHDLKYDPNLTPLDEAITESDSGDDTTYTVVVDE